MSLDHGILNTPLASRGNIDTQIDKYLSNQKAAAKAKAQTLKKLKSMAYFEPACLLKILALI